MDLVTTAIFCQFSKLNPILLIMEDIIYPGIHLSAAGFIEHQNQSHLILSADLWRKKAPKVVRCPEVYFEVIFDNLNLPIPESVKVPTSVVSGSATTASVLRKLRDISWVTFLALLAQKPTKGDGLKFEPRGKTSFVRVEGRSFKVIHTQIYAEWTVIEVSLEDSSQCPVNAVLFNPMHT